MGALLVPVNVFFLLHMEVGFRNTTTQGAGPYPSTISLFANAVFFLVILTLLNRLLSCHFPRLALGRSELIVVYVMLTVSTAIVSIDFMDVLVPMMAHPFRFATPENRWSETFLPHLPSWVCVRDADALRAWYEGHSTLYRWENLQPWLIPVAVWSGVIFVMLAVMFCINTIVSRQWIENEKLLFPIVELPMQITEEGHVIIRSKLMWAGFALAAGISLVNGIQVYYPAVPYIRVKMWDISPMFPAKPWNAMGWTPVSFYPYAIGLGFLLPVDMLFSCWFFFVMWRVIRVIGAIYGVYDVTPNFPFMNEQALGAYYLIALFALWSGRKYFSRVIRQAFSPNVGPSVPDGPLSYRMAVCGLVMGIALLSWFFHVVGLRWWVSAVAVGLYFFIALGVAKMHAEFGPPAHDLHRMGPEVVLTSMMGTKAFSVPELTAFSWFWWFNRAYRSIPIAYQLDGLKLAHRTGVTQRQMGTAIGVASFLAVVSGFWIWLHFGYERGAAVGMANHVYWFGHEAFGQRLSTWLSNPKDADVPATLAIAWGMLFTYFLYYTKLKLSWWPWHPLGFAISTSYSIGTLWLPLCIAWLCKSVTLKYGGLKTYRVALNFFFGLLLGDFLMGCTWPIVGWLVGVPTYSFMQ